MTILDPVRVGFWKTEGRATGLPFESAGLLGRMAAILVRNATEAHLPSVFDCVDTSWDPKERDRVLAYVSDHRFRKVSYMGFSTCRICGKDNGTADFADELYVWPEGFSHYIRDHAVRPPRAFVQHVTRKAKR